MRMPYLVYSNQHGLLLFCRDKDPLTSFDWGSDQNGVAVHNTDTVTGSRCTQMEAEEIRTCDEADPDDDMHPLGFSHVLSFLFCTCLYTLKLNPHMIFSVCSSWN